MNIELAIRCGRVRNFAIAVLLPTFLLSGMPAVGCSCADDRAVSMVLGLFSTLPRADQNASYCHCACCAASKGDKPCCCTAKLNGSKPDQHESRLCIQQKQQGGCAAVLHERTLSVSAAPTMIDTAVLHWAQVEFSILGAADLRRFLHAVAECNTGPPPVDLVVSLRRFLI
jgi:hypothetical protein